MGSGEVEISGQPMPRHFEKHGGGPRRSRALGSVWVGGHKRPVSEVKKLNNSLFYVVVSCFRNDGVRCSSHLSGTTFGEHQAKLDATTRPTHSPKPMRTAPSPSHQARRVTSSPSSRKLRVSPSGKLDRLLAAAG